MSDDAPQGAQTCPLTTTVTPIAMLSVLFSCQGGLCLAQVRKDATLGTCKLKYLPVLQHAHACICARMRACARAQLRMRSRSWPCDRMRYSADASSDMSGQLQHAAAAQMCICTKLPRDRPGHVLLSKSREAPVT